MIIIEYTVEHPEGRFVEISKEEFFNIEETEEVQSDG